MNENENIYKKENLETEINQFKKLFIEMGEKLKDLEKKI